MDKTQISWIDSLLVYTRPRVVAMLFLGFSAGLPLLLVFSTLTAWLHDYEVSRSAIGFFAWIGITYSVKVFWAPIVDRLPLPFLQAWLGKRRSWMFLGQMGIVSALAAMALIGPQDNLAVFAFLAVVVAFSSATQDIAIDAYRIEAAIPEHQGAMASNYILGYRLAMLVAGAGTFYIAAKTDWPTAYLAMSALMLVGTATVLIIAEPEPTDEAQALALELEQQASPDGSPGTFARLRHWLADAVVGPFSEFLRRQGGFAVIILLLIGFYRMSDITMGIMANPFYLDIGFTKIEIAQVSKIFGFLMTIVGSFVGGVLIVRYGVYRPLIAGAIMVALTNLLFSWLATQGADLQGLALVISADNLSGGFANAALIAYLSSLTNRAYTATQYALFSSLMTLPGKFFSGFSGLIVDAVDYPTFFIYAAMTGIPAIILAFSVSRHARKISDQPASQSVSD